MPEWNGMKHFKYGMEDNIPYLILHMVLTEKYRLVKHKSVFHSRSPQRCPRPLGHILKSLALKLKSLASKSTSPQKCPVLVSRTV